MVKLNFGLWRLDRLLIVLSIGLLQSVYEPAQALPVETAESSGDELAEDTFTCPDDLKTLTAELLQDLPAYGNRVIQRTQNLNQSAGIETYILTASEAELEPLGLPRLQYDRIDEEDPEQVFFTILEKQYSNGEAIDRQTYHWLFLTKTDSGWRTVILFSRFGNSNQNNYPAPPRETTNGIIGQGIQLWLRDCRAGAVRR